jgi:folylpolyglutamate synthase/dihydrofolate synthase
VSPITPAVEFLFSLERFGMKFGLANIATLCAGLGHPQDAFPSVIVAGTNGKGSVTAMVDAGLRAAGHRSARYTSPHLERLEERFVVDGQEVAPEILDRAAARIQAAVEDLVASGALASLPTFFECTTAVAFELFREARVDMAVLEVGLGGRLDSTNIVSPIAAAIVSIDFDHEEQLGHTLASIAAEKAGVIKPGIPVVCGPLPAEALDVIARVCAQQRATLIRTDADPALAARSRRCRSRWPERTSKRTPPSQYGCWTRSTTTSRQGCASARTRLPRASRPPRGRDASRPSRAASAGSCSMRRTIRPARARWRLICVKPLPAGSRSSSGRCATRRCARC